MPVPGSGLGSSVGMAEESTWGTPVTVTRWIPHVDFQPKFVPKMVQGAALQHGAFTNLSQTRANVSSMISGDMNFNFTSKQMGLLLKHAIGSVTIAQNGVTAAWTQTFTPGFQTGKGLTLQADKPTSAGAENPFTYSGCKITQWELSCAQNDILQAKFSVVGKALATATSLATQSYPTASNVFYFSQGTFSFNGSPYAALRNFTLTGNNSLTSDDRNVLNGTGLILEPIPKDFFKYNIKGTMEYIDTTVTAAFLADAECTCELKFVGKQIVTGSPNYFETLDITLTGLRLNGDDPAITGPDVLTLGFDADILVPNAGGTQLTVAYTSLDVAS